MKIKLPRKRKKEYIKKETRLSYISCQILSELLFEETGKKQKFPKLKRNPKNPKGYDIVKFY